MKSKDECPDCPGGKWDEDVGGNFVGAFIVGHSLARVTYTCKSNGAKCSGRLNCFLRGLIFEASIGWSIDTESLGKGRTISGLYNFRDVESYDTGWVWYWSAPGLSTSGNDITVTVGAGGGIGQIRCKAEYIVCKK